jgi:FkbM family methyltransferase
MPPHGFTKARAMTPVSQGGAEGRVDELVRARFFPEHGHGFLVEVGAAHPDYLSVSALYRSLGWSVLGVEPNPEFYELHRARGHDVVQYACGDHDEDDVDFSVVDSHGTAYKDGNVSFEAFSSLAIKDAYAKLMDPELSVRTIKVDLRRLDTILREHAPAVDRIDIVVVDVEGWELEVLNGLDFERFRPRVLIVENLFAEAGYRDYMRAKGYALWRHVEPNDVYVAPSEIHLRDRAGKSLAHLSARGKQLQGVLRTRRGRASEPAGV